MNEWTLSYDGFDPEHEGLREALCTLGNGCFATRGAAEEAEADEVHYPGTYLAGGYNRLATDIAGRVVENEDLVNFPNWLVLSFRPAGGAWLNLQAMEILSFRKELDLKAGILRRSVRCRDHDGRETTFHTRRIVHMGLPQLAAIELRICPHNWSGPIEVRSALDGRVVNAGVERYRAFNGRHLAPLTATAVGEDTLLLVTETTQSRLRVAQTARTRVFIGDTPAPVRRETRGDEAYIEHVLRFDIAEGAEARVEKIVGLSTSRDRAISSPELAATGAVRHAGHFGELLESHTLAWSHLWQRCDVVLEGNVRTQMILRLHIFHLLQTVSFHTTELDAGVPARGLHGEAYRGHIFWDELFIFPFLNLRIPELTRTLLQYRRRRLPAARRLAQAAGRQGAMFPWQSGSSGREESQVVHLNPRSGRWLPDNTNLQRHVNLAITYNMWRYYCATGDREYLRVHGAEMLFEIARFWAGMAVWNEPRGRYDIHGVMGPDEFHDRYPWAEDPGIDNNAYTNVLAAWVLLRALDAHAQLDPQRRIELTDRLRLTTAELERWRDVSCKLFVPFHDNGGIISQFEGYERLAEFDWEGYRRKYGDIHRLDRILEAEGDTVNRFQASKQADVLMLFYVFCAGELRELFDHLGYSFDDNLVARNIDYYVHRSSHGSTLSQVVHSWVLARMDRDRAWKLFNEALESDIADVQGGTTAEGIHLGAMAGTVDFVQRGLLGLEIYNGVFLLDPRLPDELRSLRFSIHYRGSWLDLDLDHKRFIIGVPSDWPGPEHITVSGTRLMLQAGHRLELQRDPGQGGWQPVTGA